METNSKSNRFIHPDTIEQQPGNGAWFIRHSDRDNPHQTAVKDDININHKGKQNAQLFGIKLQKHHINKIYTSPVYRCVQTARYISKGYGKNIDIEGTNQLGLPSLFVTDIDLARPFFSKNSAYDFYSFMIEGKTPAGFRSYNEAIDLLIAFLKNNSNPKGITLFISHDVFVAPLVYNICNKKFNKSDWLGFLQGVRV